MRIRIMCLLCICMILSGTCAVLTGCNKKLVNVSYDVQTQVYTNKKSGSTYTEMPFSFAVGALKEEYAVFKMGSKEYVLFEIEGLNPEKWLATSDGMILRSLSEPDIAFSSLTISKIEVCALDNPNIVIQTIEKSDFLTEVVQAAKSDCYFTLPPFPAAEKYLVRFSTAEYPGLYYTMRYMIYDEDLEVNLGDDELITNVGKFVLYDLSQRRCMAVPELGQKQDNPGQQA